MQPFTSPECRQRGGWRPYASAGLLRIPQSQSAGSAFRLRPSRFIPKLLLPSHSRLLLIQNKYQGLWPDIESWAGPKLEKQWLIYLAESREKWRATNDPAQAKAYADALSDAGHDDTLIREMLPLFSKRLDPEKDYDLMLVASQSLSAALAREGRWDDIEAVFKKASEAWPLGSEANALNIAAGRARYLFTD